MKTPKYSVTRTRATWKPRVTSADLPFVTSEDKNIILLGVSGNTESSFSGTGRTLIAHPQYEAIFEDNAHDAISFVDEEDLPEGIEVDYQIVGGFNNNAIIAQWKIPNDSSYSCEWIGLKTFTGFQLKYVLPKKRSPLKFALADEDAYAYCDKDPCEECGFRCKNGFVLYFKIKNLGIVKKELNRISMIKTLSKKNK